MRKSCSYCESIGKHAQSVCTALHERLAQAERERDAALAKAERWEQRFHEGCETYHDLRARIEALADGWAAGGMTGSVCTHLRALLQPPKAETALDLIALVEREQFSNLSVTGHDALAKLRKLLTKGTEDK